MKLETNDVDVKQWKSEYMIPCSFCIGTRTPDPDNVIVSLEMGNDTVAICNTCIKGATCAAAREFRRIADRSKEPPSKPTDPKKKRTIKYA